MGSVRVNKSGYLYLDFYYMGVRCREGTHHRTLYQTRHTFASLALASGENINWIASMMGHSTLEMIRNYNKFIPNLTRQDGILLEGYLEKVREKSYGQYLGNVLVN